MSHNRFDFYLPTKIRYGKGIISELNNEIEAMNCQHPCIITDKGLVRAGIVDQVLSQMQGNLRKNVFIFDDVEANPRDTTVTAAARQAKVHQTDIFIAIGGGSSMDVAKAAAILTVSGGTVQDYEGENTVSGEVLPIIAIPTTVGTGSEVTFFSVITNTELQFKMSILSTKIAPKVALLDPDLVADLPSQIVASTGMDALTHAIEGYTCKLSQPITDAVGIYSIRMIAENLRAAALNNDKEAKAKMLLASLLAGISFGNADIASVHAMAEALGGRYDTPHGIANAILLPVVMEYNFAADPGKFAEIALALGENIAGMTILDAAKQSVHAVKKLSAELKIPTLKETGVNEKDFPSLAAKSAANISSESNVKSINEQGYLHLFQQAFQS